MIHQVGILFKNQIVWHLLTTTWMDLLLIRKVLRLYRIELDPTGGTSDVHAFLVHYECSPLRRYRSLWSCTRRMIPLLHTSCVIMREERQVEMSPHYMNHSLRPASNSILDIFYLVHKGLAELTTNYPVEQQLGEPVSLGGRSPHNNILSYLLLETELQVRVYMRVSWN